MGPLSRTWWKRKGFVLRIDAGAAGAAFAAHQHEVKDIEGYKQGQQALSEILTESLDDIKEPEQQSTEQQQAHYDL